MSLPPRLIEEKRKTDMMKRKCLFVALLLIVFSAMLATVAFADDHGSVIDSGTCGDQLRWTLYDDGVLNITGTGAMWDFEAGAFGYDSTGKKAPWVEYVDRITSLTLEKGVSHIGDHAFHSLWALSSELVIPEGVLSIGDYAFSDCRQLSGALVLPKSLKTIGINSFSCCVSLTGALILPDSIEQIGDCAFIACGGFETLVLPSRLQIIGDRAFMDCTGLTGDLVIPGSVKQIGDWVFFECVKLRNVYFAGDAPIVGDALVGRWNGEIEATFYYEQGKTGYSYPVWRGFPCWPTDHIEAVGYEPSIQVEGISFVQEEIELKVGETAQLNIAFSPKGATDEYLTWLSTEDAIVSVKDGVIKGGDVGNARIFVITSHDGLTAVCWVNVTAEPVEHAPFYASPQIQPKVSDNINDQNYEDWTCPVNSYLYENPQGGLTRVEYMDGKIIVEDYSDTLIPQASRSIPVELPLWGGFFSGKRFNFLMFGQENTTESDSSEVVRVVKYSKDWVRLGSASLYGANTSIPFAAGSLRCVEAEGMLYIRTSHTMYKSEDGANHQASFGFAIREANMQVTDTNYNMGYVSHSFNQFLIEDPEHKLVSLDHGDGYSRSFILSRYKDITAGDPQTLSTESTEFQYFPGDIGQNHTGASVGGFAATSEGNVTAYNYDGSATRQKRDLYLAFTDKDSFETTTVKLTSGKDISTPILAARDEKGGYILWNEKTSDGGYGKTVYFAEYDQNGKVGAIKSVSAALSDCQPILYNGKLIWCVTDKSAPVFYTLDSSGLKKAIPKLRGDVNEDGTVDATDRMILARYLAKWDGYEAKIKSMDAADIDRDGNVTAKDRMILARYLAKWTVYDQYFK